MSTKNIDAIILSRKNFGEADRLISAFSRDEGKIKIIAKGVRRSKSKMAGHIEPFSYGKYFLAEGKNFYILAGAETLNSNSKLSSNLNLYKYSSYLCEITEALFVENQPNEKIFSLLKNILTLLPDLKDDQKEISIRFFEFSALKNIGYAPNFYHCKSCGKKLIEETSFNGSFEGIFCKNCFTNSKEGIEKSFLKVLRLFDDKDLNYVLKIKDIEKYNGKLKNITWPFLYDIIPKTVKSLNL